MLLSDGQVVAAGKSGRVYLLQRAALGGIGGQQASLLGVCGDDLDGGSATVASTVYLACGGGGIVAVQASLQPPSLRRLWIADSGGGPPIVAGGLLWTLGSSGELDALNLSTGAVEAQVQVGQPANHFPTPALGDGLLVVPTAAHVVAFTASANTAGSSTTASSTTTSAPAATSTTAVRAANSQHHGGNASGTWVVLGLAAAIAVGAAGLGWRRRRGRQRRRPAP